MSLPFKAYKSEDGPTSRRPVPVVPLAQWKVRWGFRCLLEKKMYFGEPCVTTNQSISKSEDSPTSRRPVPVVPLAQ